MPFRPDAGALQGKLLSDILPIDGQAFVYNSVADQYLIESVASFDRALVDDADHAILVTERLLVITALTAARTITLPPASENPKAVFLFKDESGKAGTYNVSVVVSGGGTIDGLISIKLRADYAIAMVYSDGSEYHCWGGVKNSGQVKINTGNSVKPTLVWTAPQAGDFKDIQYDLPLGLSLAPTTTWPRNISAPVDSDIYDDTNETFIENVVPGQINIWRMIFNYSGKSNGVATGIEVRVRNTISGFSNTQTVYLPTERTSGQFAVEMTTIADMASLPAPWGTGQGYVFDISADDPITIEVDNIVRINNQID